VLEAQQAALEALTPGRAAVDIDRIARDIISRAGFGNRFGHGLGHGVGLEIHEEPRLSQWSEDRLREGMVVTVEPGIYVPGWGGIRIEDLVVITSTGHRNLTRSTKRLSEI
jgi:Xaa-Pro aminopeptidase